MEGRVRSDTFQFWTFLRVFFYHFVSQIESYSLLYSIELHSIWVKSHMVKFQCRSIPEVLHNSALVLFGKEKLFRENSVRN